MLYGLMGLLAILAIFGLYLQIRSFIRLYQEKELKLLACCLGYFLAAPLLVTLVARLGPTRRSVWLVLPAVLLALGWVALGYVLEFYLRRLLRRRLLGRVKTTPPRPAHWLRDNSLRLAGSLVLWLIGVFLPISSPLLETMALCLCLFLLVRGLWGFWHYRGF